jgi:Xaa-Pro aminopeptidase
MQEKLMKPIIWEVDHMEKFLVFQKEEYEARAAKARKLMAERGLDACVFTKGSNVTYFSGYLSYLFSSDFRPFFFVLPLNDDPVFVIPEFEKPGALQTSWCDNARTWGTFAHCETADPIEMLSITLHDLKLDGCNIGFELTNGQRLGMTQYQLADLQQRLPNMKMKPNDPVVWGCRSIKSSAELEYLKKCGRANDMGCKKAVEAMHVGATEKDIELAMCKGFIEGGAIPNFMTITSGAERNSMPNPVASNNVLKKGDMLVMDFGCTYEGYISDSTRCVFIGEAPERGKELFKAVIDIHDYVVDKIKPGIPASALQEACNKRMDELGYMDLFLHRVGHSLGREIHELPSLDSLDHTILQPGMVLAIEPALYEYSTGPVRMEDNIVVTGKGFEYLTNFSRQLIVTGD